MQTNIGVAVNTVTVDWAEISNEKCLRITIKGRLTEKTANEAILQWKEAFDLQHESGEKINIICSCLKMTGYDTNARKMWQNTISELKDQIGYFWIVTDNKLFVIAARTMGLITKFKLRTVSSENDIRLE